MTMTSISATPGQSMSHSFEHGAPSRPLQSAPIVMPQTQARRGAKADKATRRAGWTFLVPFLGVPVVAFYYFVESDLVRAALALAATSALALLLGPFILWWSVSGIRRGSRHILLGVFLGFVGGTLTTGLIAALISSGLGWSLISGEPAAFLPEGFDVTRWIFLSPENPLNPAPLMETAQDLSSSR